MKNLFIVFITVFTFISTHIKANITTEKYCEDKKINVQEKDAKDIYADLIEKHAKLKEKIALLRIKVQAEMRKDNPNWDKIEKLSDKIKDLQTVHEEEIVECMHKIKLMQPEIPEDSKKKKNKKIKKLKKIY